MRPLAGLDACTCGAQLMPVGPVVRCSSKAGSKEPLELGACGMASRRGCSRSTNSSTVRGRSSNCKGPGRISRESTTLEDVNSLNTRNTTKNRTCQWACALGICKGVQCQTCTWMVQEQTIHLDPFESNKNIIVMYMSYQSATWSFSHNLIAPAWCARGIVERLCVEPQRCNLL